LGLLSLLPTAIFQTQNIPRSMVVGASPQVPLGKLTELPRPSTCRVNQWRAVVTIVLRVRPFFYLSAFWTLETNRKQNLRNGLFCYRL